MLCNGQTAYSYIAKFLSYNKFYGIWGVSGDFLKSYLFKVDHSLFRSIIVYPQSKNSMWCSQGSVLGPILFNIYVNDILYASEVFKFVLFADDTNIFFSSKNYEYVENTLNTELTKVREWLCTNILFINLSKTNYMIFFSKTKTMVNLNISINNNCSKW